MANMAVGTYSQTYERTNETTFLLTDNDEKDGEGNDDESTYSDDNIFKISSRDGSEPGEKKLLSVFEISCILSSAFAYGCIMTTLFLITLPVECARIENQFPNVPKSVSFIDCWNRMLHAFGAPLLGALLSLCQV